MAHISDLVIMSIACIYVRPSPSDAAGLCTLRPVLLYNRLLVHLAHGITFDVVHDLENSWDLIRGHFGLEMLAQALEFEWLGLPCVSLDSETIKRKDNRLPRVAA